MRALEPVSAPHLVALALCAGLAASLLARAPRVAVVVGACAFLLAALAFPRLRTPALVAAVFATGWWWGSARLDALDRSVLVHEVGRSALARVEVTGPARRTEFALRVPVRVLRFGDLAPAEPARLELPLRRAPPQGAVLEVVARVARPRRAEAGERFDERAYLRQHGVHVVLRADWSRAIGRRGGVLGFGDRLRARVANASGRGLDAERRAVVAGVVLGEDEGLDPELLERFRASGLYHLLSEFKTSGVVPSEAPPLDNSRKSRPRGRRRRPTWKRSGSDGLRRTSGPPGTAWSQAASPTSGLTEASHIQRGTGEARRRMLETETPRENCLPARSSRGRSAGPSLFQGEEESMGKTGRHADVKSL